MDIGPGYGPKWQDDTTFLYEKGDSLTARDITTNQDTQLARTGFVYFDVASDGRWVGEVSGNAMPYLLWSDGGVWPNFSTPAISSTRWAALDHDSGALYAGLGQGQSGELLDTGCLEPRLLDNVLVYRKGNRIFGQVRHGGPVQELSIPGEEHFWPVPVTVGSVLWVLTNTNTGRLLLYPWGSTEGYVVANGITDFADARDAGIMGIRVAWSEQGILKERYVNLALPRVDLTVQADVPWSNMPGAITDIQERLRRLASAESGKVLWFCKAEGMHTGAWMDIDFHYGIGLLCDTSTGQMFNGQPNANWFDANHLWLPFSVRDHWETAYDTDFCWTDGTRTHEHVKVSVDVGHARFNGIDVDMRHTYDPRRTDPANPRRKTGYLEYSFYNHNGQVRWEEWQDDANGVPQFKRATQPYPAVPDVFRPVPRPQPFPPTLPFRVQPTMTAQDLANTLKAFPQDVFLDHYRAYCSQLLDRDRAGQEGISDGAVMIFFPAFYGTAADLIVQRGIPGGAPADVAAKWNSIADAAGSAAVAAYNKVVGR